MNTIVLTMEEAAQDLATLIRRMRERREYVVVKDGEGPLAYLTLAFRPDPKEAGAQACAEGTPEEYCGPRVSKRTGLPKEPDGPLFVREPPARYGIAA
jgi:hypothetical protein